MPDESNIGYIVSYYDEVLKMFLDWLETNQTAIIMSEDQGQPAPFTGELPHNWLKGNVDYYEEMLVDHKAIDIELKELKTKFRLQYEKIEKIQCEIMRSVIPVTAIDDFLYSLQSELFRLHKENLPSC